jgi:hypothetical protein
MTNWNAVRSKGDTMKLPNFDAKGLDTATYAPFTLQNCMATEWADVRLAFSDWDWLHARCGGDTVDDYYLNGPGVEGLVKAVMLEGKLDVESEAIHFNSEGDTCYIHFKDLAEATKVASLAAEMINQSKLFEDAIRIAREHGFDDG